MVAGTDDAPVIVAHNRQWHQETGDPEGGRKFKLNGITVTSDPAAFGHTQDFVQVRLSCSTTSWQAGELRSAYEGAYCMGTRCHYICCRCTDPMLLLTVMILDGMYDAGG